MRLGPRTKTKLFKTKQSVRSKWRYLQMHMPQMIHQSSSLVDMYAENPPSSGKMPHAHPSKKSKPCLNHDPSLTLKNILPRSQGQICYSGTRAHLLLLLLHFLRKRSQVWYLQCRSSRLMLPRCESSCHSMPTLLGKSFGRMVECKVNNSPVGFYSEGNSCVSIYPRNI